MRADSNIETLQKKITAERNQYHSMVLHYITQPNYLATHAIQANIGELAVQVDDACKEPAQIHNTGLTDALKQQGGIKKQLLNEYENTRRSKSHQRWVFTL